MTIDELVLEERGAGEALAEPVQAADCQVQVPAIEALDDIQRAARPEVEMH
jgi:hypothetical protein